MRFIQKTACILLLVISTQPSTLAQSPPATKPVTEQTPVERTRPENPILQKVTSVLERVLEAQKTFADENLRVMIRAHIADMLWSYDQPRARRIFEDALQAAERLADQDATSASVGSATLFPVRTQVIRLILPLDPDWATRLVESRGELLPIFSRATFAGIASAPLCNRTLRSTLLSEIVQRAVLAARPIAESGESRSLMLFLSLIRSRDVQAADELYLLALAKARLRQSAFFDILTFAHYVLPSFGEGVLRPSTDKSNSRPVCEHKQFGGPAAISRIRIRGGDSSLRCRGDGREPVPSRSAFDIRLWHSEGARALFRSLYARSSASVSRSPPGSAATSSAGRASVSDIERDGNSGILAVPSAKRPQIRG